MPSYKRKVDIPGISAATIYDKVSVDIVKFLSKMPLKGYEILREQSTCQVRVKSPMFDVILFCEENSVRLDGSLSLMALPFKSMLDNGIDQWLAKTFPKS